jgi:hypothetical protein
MAALSLTHTLDGKRFRWFWENLSYLRRRGFGEHNVHDLLALRRAGHAFGHGDTDAERIKDAFLQAMREEFGTDARYTETIELWYGFHPSTQGRPVGERHRIAYERFCGEDENPMAFISFKTNVNEQVCTRLARRLMHMLTASKP